MNESSVTVPLRDGARAVRRGVTMGSAVRGDWLGVGSTRRINAA